MSSKDKKSSSKKDKAPKGSKSSKGKKEVETSSHSSEAPLTPHGPPSHSPPPVPSPSQNYVAQSSYLAGDSPTTIKHSDEVRFKLSHHNMIDDKIFHDVILQFNKLPAPGEKGKSASSAGVLQLHAHAAIINLRCEKMLSEPEYCVKGKTKVVRKGVKSYVVNSSKLTVVTPEIMLKILEFLYTDEVDLQNLQIPLILDILLTSDQYGLTRLSWLCERHLRSLLSVDIVCSMLTAANDRKLDSVKLFCQEFAINHFQQVVTDKSGASVLGLNLYQELISLHTSGQKVNAPLSPEPPSEIINVYKTIYEQLNLPGADGQIQVGDEMLRVHKAVLAAHSSKLANLFKGQGFPSKDKKNPEPYYVLDEKLTNPQVAKKLLQFIYYGECSIAPLFATELLTHITGKYELADLQNLCLYIISHNVGADTVLPILSVCYLQHLSGLNQVESLKRAAIKYVVDNVTQIKLEPLREMDPQISVALIFALQDHAKRQG